MRVFCLGRSSARSAVARENGIRGVPWFRIAVTTTRIGINADRGYRLPCVVGVGTATQMIKTGDLVEVDGSKGSVRVIRG